MSHSRKKYPIGGHTKRTSEKRWKKHQHKRLRLIVKNKLRNQEECFLDLKDISDICDGPKDGKGYCIDTDAKWMRK